MEVLPGSALRDHIARFLRLKYSTVEIEKRLTSTTADVLFVDDTNHLFKQVIAVEAKDWAKPLSSSNIAKIFNDYKPSIDLNEIDHLWIIGRHSLSSSQIETLSRLRVVKYSSLDEFNTSLMNFTNLITHNILSFTHHEVFDNYISTRSLDRNISMDAVVDEWLTSDARGLMVFGGYGIGKTTYSLYLAKRYSEKYQSDPSSRIPVRISLGGFYTKQDLIGLYAQLNGEETACSVPNFSYHLFLEMSRSGHLILILDGFDEMRHAMDFEDFLYVFEQMQPLFQGNSKVILLGRPDSFLTNREEDEAIAALFESGANVDRKIKKSEVAFFSREDISRYIDHYIQKREKPFSSEQRARLEKILKEIPDKDDSILSRPVQLRMFTTIMDDLLIVGLYTGSFLVRRRSLPVRISRLRQRPLH